MSDLITINTNCLEEAIRCAICKNPIKSKRGCDGNCQYDKEMLSKVIDAVEGLAVERPRGEWLPYEWDDNYSTKIQLPKGSVSHMEEYWDEEFICSVCWKAHHARDFCPYCGSPMTEKALEILRKREGEEK